MNEAVYGFGDSAFRKHKAHLKQLQKGNCIDFHTIQKDFLDSFM